jgi:hypothetical protein
MVGYKPLLADAIYTSNFSTAGVLTTQSDAQRGVQTIDTYLLSKGKPITVGLNINGGSFAGNVGHEQTQHYVVIDGVGTDAGGKFYHYVDPYPGHGSSSANKLYVNSDYSLTGKSTYGTGKTFTVTEVRPQ